MHQVGVNNKLVIVGNAMPARRFYMSTAKNHCRQKPRGRHSAYRAVDESRVMLEEKAKNRVTKNFPQDAT